MAKRKEVLTKLLSLGVNDADVIKKVMEAEDWDENQHPRGKGGKFVSKGSGGGGGSSKSDEKKSEKGKGGKASKSASGKNGGVVRKLTPKAQKALNTLHKATSDQSKICEKKAKQWPEGSGERKMYEQYAGIMSKPQAGRPTKEESKAMTQKFLSNISSQLKPYAVEKYKRDLANEPKITNDLCDVADEIGTEMFGLNFRLKKASDSGDGGCRVAEKIAEDMNDRKNPLTYEQATDKLSDLVRYTQACTADNLVDNYEKTRAALEKKGYKPVKVKNTWDSYNIDNAYRGVNCVFESPTGTKFELQFHTPESLVGKEVQHGQYEEFRKPNTTPERKKELGQMMYNNMHGMKRPKGIEKITNYP